MQKSVIVRLSGGGGNSFKLLKRFSAFTLSELLITILIVGIIAAVTLPSVQKAMPDKLEAMRKKSYFALENNVTAIVKDEGLYWTKQDGTYGLMNTDAVRIVGETYSGRTKFCELYAKMFNKRSGSAANCTFGAKTFTGVDNVDWYLPVTDFSNGYAPVTFDVNGKEEPNCSYNATSCPHPDKFTYYILTNGKIVEQEPNIKLPTYCIRTSITGNGTVSPSAEYCGLKNGTYILTANPAEGWKSDWVDNKKEVVVKNADKAIKVNFSEVPKACITLNVNCASGTPGMCGKYTISGASFKTEGNTLKACNLPANTYSINVSPYKGYIPSWTSQSVLLEGMDTELTVDITIETYCAILDVDCPQGNAATCGTYTITTSSDSVQKVMTASYNQVKACSLNNGYYSLNVNINPGYKQKSIPSGFTIRDKDWTGNASFEKLCTHEYAFSANGKRWGCIFKPTPMTKEECEKAVAEGKLGIRTCPYDTDYWAGAVRECGGVQNLPSMEDLASFVPLIYEGSPTVKIREHIFNLTYKPGKATSIGMIEPKFALCSDHEGKRPVNIEVGGVDQDIPLDHPEQYEQRSFGTVNSQWGYSWRYNSGLRAVCRLK